jgi:hypothetical protein
MAKTPFPLIPELMAIAIAFVNNKLIADMVLPRIPVGKLQFQYLEHKMEEGFTLPETKVGRKGIPNQVEFNATLKTGSVEDFALDDIVPNDDVDNAPKGYDPLGRAVEGLTNLILLKREVRTASLVFNPNSYPSTNKVALSGTSQFSDYTNSDPIKTITDALDAMIMRANKMVIGRSAYSVLARHPKIMKAVNKNAGDTGIANRKDIADLFELDDILVGEGWVNTAKKGEPVSLQRVWGKNISLIYQDMTATTTQGVTFGVTAQYGTRIAGSMPQPKVGARGAQLVRSGESVSELILAGAAGYYIQSVC